MSFLGRFVSSLLSAIIVSKLLCLSKCRRSKGEAPGHRGMQCEGECVWQGGGDHTAVGGTVFWRSVNLSSIRPPERVGFPAGITQTCGPALKNTLALVSRNASLPWLVEVSQNISASQCYRRREPDSEKDTFKLGLKPTAGFPPQGKNKMSIVCKDKHHGLPPPSSVALLALQLLQHLQKPQQKGNTTKDKPKVVCGEVSFRSLQKLRSARGDVF